MLTHFDLLHDPLFGEAFFRGLVPMRSSARGQRPKATPAIEVLETPERLVLHTELPGFKDSEIDLEINERVLTIRAAHQPQAANDDAVQVVNERRHGPFLRQFRLPTSVDEEAVNASMEHGVLTVSFLKRVRSPTRKIGRAHV